MSKASYKELNNGMPILNLNSYKSYLGKRINL